MLDKILKIVGLVHPSTKQVDVLLTLVVFVVVIVAMKFFLSGVIITIGIHTISFGSTDGWAYGSVLSPMLAAHGFNSSRNTTYASLDDAPTRYIPDNPDSE